MEKTLTAQNDPRMLGKGDLFDYYPQAREAKIKNLYKEKYYNMWDKFFEKYGYKTPAIPEGFVGKDGE
jgi:N-sulfoglucosamine sulfohydrolase